MTWLAGSNKRWVMADGLVALLDAAPDTAMLASLWRQVEPLADGSIFQSWSWLGCRFAARFDRPVVLSIARDGVVLAIGLLNRRRGVWALGETGDAVHDSVFIEHNGPLVVRNQADARDAWYAALLRFHGGFVRLSGVNDADMVAVRGHGVMGGLITRPAPRRDLAQLRAAGADCLDRVSSNTRQQIKRALRRYGSITVTRAPDAAQAMVWLDDLARLHQATWQGRGKPGAFAQPAFRAFHHDMIAHGVEAGTVDLLRITAGARLVGYLYNFVWRGVASAYQSGFVYDVAHPHEKPGLTCHVAAMRHYQARGLDIYDFLAGADRYKTSLADGSVELHWIRAARRTGAAGVILALRNRIRSQE